MTRVFWRLTFRTMQQSSVLMAPAWHMYVRLEQKEITVNNTVNMNKYSVIRLWFAYHLADVSCISTGLSLCIILTNTWESSSPSTSTASKENSIFGWCHFRIFTSRNKFIYHSPVSWKPECSHRPGLNNTLTPASGPEKTECEGQTTGDWS